MTAPISSSTATSPSTSGAGAVSSSVSGVISGIQWQNLVDETIAANSARLIDPVNQEITNDNNASAAWSQYESLSGTLRDTANTLRDTAFDAVQPFSGTDSSGRPLFTMTGAAGAATGDYQVQVQSLAQTDKIGSGLVANATTPLGLTGDFYVNQTRISVTAANSLSDIRDLINSANSGTTTTGVSATVLSAGTSSNRLVLTAAQTGASGIELADGTGNILSQLGITDGTSAAATDATGGSESTAFTTPPRPSPPCSATHRHPRRQRSTWATRPSPSISPPTRWRISEHASPRPASARA